MLQDCHRAAEGSNRAQRVYIFGGKGENGPHNELVELREDMHLKSARRRSSAPEKLAAEPALRSRPKDGPGQTTAERLYTTL